MKKAIQYAAVLSVIASPTLAENLIFEITSMANREKDPDVYSLDRCDLGMSVKNETGFDIALEVAFSPVLDDGSFSDIVSGAIGDASPLNSHYIGVVNDGETVASDTGLMAVDCDDVQTFVVKPTCTRRSGGDSCAELAVASPDSVIGVLMTSAPDGSEPIGQAREAEPGGPMQGTWTVSAGGEQIIALDILDDSNENLSGQFRTFPAICPLLDAGEDCARGDLNKEIRSVYGGPEDLTVRLMMTDELNQNAIILKASPASGEGTMIDDETYKNFNITFEMTN
ncbi:hypothetical protein [Thalassobius sp. I31.1]|uniref:hypothetical protein n=1 Tax=Thalassobius sp. I31.1 TaxID=2109912 RepID=UPI000D199AAE|nr:hypothetical protein [Thalassobius sp. I31.1]